MDEYIKRELAIEALSRGEGCGNVCRRAIERVHAADVAPVQHGRWVYPIGMAWNYVCSECGKSIGVIKHKYCPNCGCTMDLEVLIDG